MCLRVDRRVVARGGGAVQKFNSPEPVEGIILIYSHDRLDGHGMVRPTILSYSYCQGT